MPFPTEDMSILIDCDGYVWQLHNHYWRSPRYHFKNIAFYIENEPAAYGVQQSLLDDMVL